MPPIGSLTRAMLQNGGTQELSVAGLSGELAYNQPPKAHAASHAGGGSDPVSAGAYVDRGDPAAVDFSLANFTRDSAWHDLSLAAIVPAGGTVVHVRIIIQIAVASVGFRLREKGNANIHNAALIFSNLSGYISGDFLVRLDANRVIQYMADTNVSWGVINLTVAGWF